MNRNAARLLTTTGFFFCTGSAVATIIKIAANLNFSPILLSSFFVAGIILAVVSLAYYTEK